MTEEEDENRMRMERMRREGKMEEARGKTNITNKQVDGQVSRY